MAEYLLRDRLKSKGKRDIRISSAGFLDQTGARSPKEIHVVMDEAGIDILEHRSALLTLSKVVMEAQQRIVLMKSGD